MNNAFQNQNIRLEPGTLVDLRVRAEDVPVLFKALKGLTIDEGETLFAMVKSQIVAASTTSKAQEQATTAAQAAPDQNTEARALAKEAIDEPELGPDSVAGSAKDGKEGTTSTPPGADPEE